MKIRWRVWGLGGMGFVFLMGCGGTEHDGSPSAGGVGNPGGTTQGGANLGGANQGGSGSPLAGGSSAGSGQGGASAVGCNGTFGESTVALAAESGVLLGSPTFSPDGLELIYARKADALIEFRRSVRTSVDVAFAVGSALPSLDAACQAGDDRSVDLSTDGLRAYVACYSATASPVGPAVLHVAERAAVGQDFTPRAGTVMVGPSAAISADELTLYSASEVDPGSAQPRQFTRTTKADVFGAAMDIPGLEQVFMTAPEPSPDGLAMYGGLKGSLNVVTRASVAEPFGAPTVLVPAATASDSVGAPELSKDCRSLFYLLQTYIPAMSKSEATLMVMRR